MVGLFGCFCDAGASGRVDFVAAGFMNHYPRIWFGIFGVFLLRLKRENSAAVFLRRPCCFAHCLEFAL